MQNKKENKVNAPLEYRNKSEESVNFRSSFRANVRKDELEKLIDLVHGSSFYTSAFVARCVSDGQKIV